MDSFDLLVIGGGINGAAIARDAAGRGLKVLLVEKDDLAAHTSSASSKLIHGGLRYLEQYEFGLVRESLRERSFLLANAPHIVRPLKFVLPDPPGGRPFWLLRSGLLLYDLLAGGRSKLPRSRHEKGPDPALRPSFRLASYWDAWVDDARLVVLNALDAHERGAEIATRTELISAHRQGERWRAELSGGRTISAGAIVNAAGSWVAEVLRGRLDSASRSKVRLVKGSHILVPRLWGDDTFQYGEIRHAYILQKEADGRIVFALPYDGWTLIGTTDIAVDRPEDAEVSEEEIRYLCETANAYFTRQTAARDVIWSYAGIRALYDDGEAEAKDVTRDYHLELDPAPGARLLSVFGGKLTTARALAEEALARLGVGGARWTARSPLPGGDFRDASEVVLPDLRRWMPPAMVERLAYAYGTRLRHVLAGATSIDQLGRHFGAGLYAAEVCYLIETEFARTAEDILWRRTKLGLAMAPGEQQALRDYLRG